MMTAIDDLLARFEDRWRSAEPPDLRSFLNELPAGETGRPEVVAEFIALDLEYRARQVAARETISPVADETKAAKSTDTARTPTLDDYTDWLPNLTTATKAWAELIAEEYRVRQRWGDQPTIDEYTRRYGAGEAVQSALRNVKRELDRDGISRDARPAVSEPAISAKRTVLDPPREFGRYRLLECVGRGGMGDVYRAFDTRLNRDVALKIPRLDRDDPTRRERFLNEARVAATLRNPHICPVFDSGTIEGSPYLTMAFIEGETLAETWSRGALRSVPIMLDVLIQVAEATASAHTAGIVHRDLKPSNIMIDEQQRAVITDFGLAQRTDRDEGSRLTRSGDFLGSPAYMAPEQIACRVAETGPACDIYSLGVILFEGLTGTRPFNGSPGELTAAVQRDAPPRPSELEPAVDPDLETLCLRMLAKDPSERPESMTAVAGQLRGIRDHFPEESSSRVPRTGPGTGIVTPLRGVLLAGFAAAAVLLAIMVIRVQTDRGTLLIRSEVPGVAVAIRRGTEQVDRFQVKTGEQETTIASGRYELVLTGSAIDGVQLSENSVTLSRGKTTVVTIERIADKALPENPPAVVSGVSDEWLQKAEQLPPEERLKAVLARLKELNPKFAGEVDRVEMMDAGAPYVYRLHLNADHLADLSPLVALKRLVHLSLEARKIGSTGLCGVADLTPLAKLRYLESLVIWQAPQLEDLSPLRGLPIRLLAVNGTRVHDLSPLAGMELESLTVNFPADWRTSKPVDLSPLTGMKTLQRLQIRGTKTSDLSPLKGIPLIALIAENCPLEDISSLDGMPLRILMIDSDVDLSPIRGMPLEQLTCRPQDLSILREFRLVQLNIRKCPIDDLSPLAEMKTLRWLDCNDCRNLTDLTPIANLKLKQLSLSRTGVTDLAAIRNMPLTQIDIPTDLPDAGYELLRSMNTLETINGIPAAEFWKARDAENE